jgi:large subunit ribosomal protein L18
MKHIKRHRTISRKIRIRHKLKAHSQRPRLTVFRSSAHIFAQIINDHTGSTIVSADDLKLDTKSKKPLTKTEKAAMVGKEIATHAQKANISTVTYDRGPYKYHGRVKALAEAARTAGLKI